MQKRWRNREGLESVEHTYIVEGVSGLILLLFSQGEKDKNTKKGKQLSRAPMGHIGHRDIMEQRLVFRLL